MLKLAWTLLLLIGLSAPAVAQATRPAAPPPDSGPIPQQILLKMYQQELGPQWNDDLAEPLRAAHDLVENYFAATKAAERKAIVAKIDELKLDPNLVGRITRIRAHWPQLAGGAYYVNEKFGAFNVKYFLGIPAGYDRSKSWPLVIKLPGAAPFVRDPPPTADEVVRLYQRWMEEELRAHPDAIVLMPLLDLMHLYGPGRIGMNTVIQPMLHANERLNIDPARVYLFGHSMSGHAAWNLPLHYPTYFAATNPLAAAASRDWQRIRLPNLKNIYPVIWHDANDDIIKVKSARDVVTILARMKYRYDYEETKLLGHVPSNAVVERCYRKMREITRPLYPKDVALRSDRQETIFNRADWAQIYLPLNTGPDRKVILARGREVLPLYQNACGLTAVDKGNNRIEVISDNVEIMRFYFNDQMIDFGRPVTIVVNGRIRYEDMVKTSTEEMLKDQVSLGRGWRYFTGYAEVDFGAIAAKATTTTSPATRRGKIEYTPPR